MRTNIAPVEKIRHWLRSDNGDSLISYTIPIDATDQQIFDIRETAVRVKETLKGLVSVIRMTSPPPPLTIRPLWKIGGFCRTRSNAETFSEVITLSPFAIFGEKAYPLTPEEIKRMYLHELTHYLIGRSGGEHLPPHGPAFSMLYATLLVRCGLSLSHMQLYDFGIEDKEKPEWHDPQEWSEVDAWGLYMPIILRKSMQQSSSDLTAEAIAEASVLTFSTCRSIHETILFEF